MTDQETIVTVFGSSRPRDGSDEYRLAYTVGQLIARAGYTVCNGGYAGTMEAGARGAREAGGHTIGVTASAMTRHPNKWIEKEIKTATLPERLLKLIEIAHAYVVLRGGTGTLLELAAVWEFVNRNVIPERPIVVVGLFWDPVVNTLKDELTWEGPATCASLVQRAATAEEGISILKQSLHA